MGALALFFEAFQSGVKKAGSSFPVRLENWAWKIQISFVFCFVKFEQSFDIAQVAILLT